MTSNLSILLAGTRQRTILSATLIAGILDALAAIIVYGAFNHFTPVAIYQFVASAVLGTTSYSGGLGTALLGLVFHFFIAFAFSWLYVRVSPSIPWLNKKPIPAGLLYGLIVWAVMNLVVIPLTKIPPSPFDIVSVISIAWHLVLVGLPIALITGEYAKIHPRPAH
jgi:uncharacterized membrane protein YagU involved in acid resistance